MRRALFLAALVAVSGCASLDPYAEGPVAASLERDDTVGYCARLFADVDRRVDTLGVRDSGNPRVPGFPYLRVDRFSAALAQRVDADAARKAWWTRLAQLDDEARGAELSNAALDVDDLARCRVLLAAADAAVFDTLLAAATVPDDYSMTMRTFGVYPLTRLPFAAGVARWQADTRATFAAPLETLPVRGKLVRYAVITPEPAAVKLPAGADALGVPVLSRFDRTALLIRHAPLLEIDVAGEHDRPGTMALDAGDRAVVDPARAVAYTRVAYTLLASEVHLQLVYTFWFSERPAASAFDVLAGRLDGLVWRVTLDRDGTPLVYDSIHPCGCFHLFFPTERMRSRPAPDTLDETMFSPQAARVPGPQEAIVLRVEAGSHYLQRVSVGPRAAANGYRLDDERRLTALARPAGGTRSAYGPDGLVAGTERAERWFFWPMGIESSGQMRQWGRHATAFVGRRHFDDPLLFDAYFELRR
jgi:hypothetical protein